MILKITSILREYKGEISLPSSITLRSIIVEKKKRVMIQCHPKIQLFTILPMWQGGPSLLFEFFYFLKIN
jgi:hypothetical protein